jgi:hydroxyacylglutathione hydrolase
LFSGDTFGMSYREFDTDGRQFVFPSSSPTQFDPEAAHRSLDLIVGLNPGAIYVTHYSQVHEIARLADDMHRLVDAHAQLALSERSSGAARYDRLLAGVTDIALNEARRYGWRLGRQEVLDVLGMDIELNAQGLVIWLDAMKPA